MEFSVKNTTHLGVRVSREQKAKIRKIAAAEYRTVNGQLRFMIDNWESLMNRDDNSIEIDEI